MDVQKEFERLEKINASGKFIYKGIEFKLDRGGTSEHPDNKYMKNKPLCKLVGEDDKGNTIQVWSHDVEPCPEAAQVLDPGVNTVKVAETPKPRKSGRPKKKQA
jgi:hypothetical protein